MDKVNYPNLKARLEKEMNAILCEYSEVVLDENVYSEIVNRLKTKLREEKVCEQSIETLDLDFIDDGDGYVRPSVVMKQVLVIDLVEDELPSVSN